MKLELISVGYCHSPECLLVRGGAWRIIRQPFLVGLLDHPTRGRWLVDTGLHARLWRSTWWVRLFMAAVAARLPFHLTLAEQLRERNFVPQGMFLSHLHIDHVAGLLDFPEIPLITSRLGYQTFRLSRGWRSGFDAALLPADFEARCLWLEDLPWVHGGRDVFGDGSALAVPLEGHAPGQHGLLFPQLKKFLTADACGLSLMLEEGRNALLPRLIAHDRSAESSTLKELRALRGRRPEIQFLPSHCPKSFDIEIFG